MTNAEEQLALAKEQLERVQDAWWEPDWADLALYGFYCLENAVTAAATHLGIQFKRTHPGKAEAAEVLHSQHSLPDIVELLQDLNAARKAEAYGDIARPQLDAEDVAKRVEEYVELVEGLLDE